jgi:hypothetical protein
VVTPVSEEPVVYTFRIELAVEASNLIHVEYYDTFDRGL